MVYDSLDGQKAQCGPGGRAAPRGLHLLRSVRWLRVCCQPRGPARSCATGPWRAPHRGISSLIGSVLGHRSAHMSRHTHWDIMGEGIQRKRRLNTGWRNTLLQWFFETAYPPTYTHTWTQTDERTRQRACTRTHTHTHTHTHTNKSWEILGLRTTVLFRLMLSDPLILRNAWNWEHVRTHARTHTHTHTLGLPQTLS